jgi:DNA-binding response OmpR family regulator
MENTQKSYQMTNKTISIVEDEVLIADYLASHVNEWGYKVLSLVDNADDFLQSIKQDTPDLALLDIRLYGEKTGIDIAKELHKQQIPFIFITAQYDEATLALAMETLPAGFITKPFTPENVKAQISLALYKTTAKENNTIDLKDGFATLKIKKEEVMFLEADHVYVHYAIDKKAVAEKKITIRKTLKEAVDELGGKDFVQVHQSFAVLLRFG